MAKRMGAETIEVKSSHVSLISHPEEITAADPRSSAGLKMHNGSLRPPIIPAAFFGIVLGLAGLGSAWRAAHQAWQLPALVGEVLMALAAMVWALLLVLFILKWILTWEEALSEAHHPIQCCFIGLAGVATMLIAWARFPIRGWPHQILFCIGAAFTVAFATWRTGLLWRGEREHNATTPVLYLPTVAGGFVMATVASALGYSDWGQLAFGAALFSWLAIESVLLHRLYTVATMPPALRPTLGIQLAPPTVGAVAYLSVNGGTPDLVAHALVGYGLMQAALLLGMLPWSCNTVPPVLLGLHVRHLGARHRAAADGGQRRKPAQSPFLAPYLFIAANVAIGLIALGTLRLIAQRRLLVQPAAPHVPSDAAARPAA